MEVGAERLPWLDPPEVGSVFGRYELVGQLAWGSTSIVYSGRHRKLRIPVAVKFLHRGALEDSPGLLTQLVSEAVLLAQLNHPNIVRLWDLEDQGRFPYLVLEYVDGTTLAKLIGQMGMVPPALAFAVIRQAVEGLAEAHKLGIVHRDVKPGNLLISRTGIVKVTDLGLAMVVGDRLSRHAADHQGDRLPAGTAAYLAPEQAINPARVDFRADVYSLGATLYHAVTGRLPFAGRSPMDVIRKHLSQPPVPPRNYVPEMSAECSDLILSMLAKKPEDRPASYEDLRVALARAVGDRRAPRPLAEAFMAFVGPT